MASYYVNKNHQSNGDHEVHKEGCKFLPYPQNRIYLGEHYECRSAVAAAIEYYHQVNGCYYCSNHYHTQ